MNRKKKVKFYGAAAWGVNQVLREDKYLKFRCKKGNVLNSEFNHILDNKLTQTAPVFQKSDEISRN